MLRLARVLSTSVLLPAAHRSLPAVPTTPWGRAQEFKLLEDAAFKVLERVETTKAALAAKGEELAAIRSEYEQKKKEVSTCLRVCVRGAVQGVYVVSTDA